jgi:hypothetical protein
MSKLEEKKKVSTISTNSQNDMSHCRACNIQLFDWNENGSDHVNCCWSGGFKVCLDCSRKPEHLKF